MGRKRRNFTAEFKAKVALELLEGDKLNNVMTLATLIGGKTTYILISMLIGFLIIFSGIYLGIAYFWIFISAAIFIAASMFFENSERLISML